VAVTGKPAGRTGQVLVWYMCWPCIFATYAAVFLIFTLYMTIVVGSLTRVWGVDYTLDLRHYATAITRGIEAFMDTTFLSAVATPLAGVAGMVIAYLVVRKAFSGKEILDFASNLGGAVPGTVLGIGYILAFIQAPLLVVGMVYLLLAGYLAAGAAPAWRQLGLVTLGSLLGHGLLVSAPWYGGDGETRVVVWAFCLVIMAVLGTAGARPQVRWHVPLLLGGMGGYLFACSQMPHLTVLLAAWGRSLGGLLAPKIITNLADEIDVFFRPPLALVGLLYALLGAYVVRALRPCWSAAYALGLIALSYALVFAPAPLALVGTPYIIIAAYAVRSLPASVRAGVAALQQIDPSIEEASTNLGADTSYTFRRITLPLILPAFMAGLIFSFARHMTSLSAIIFLTTPRWRILTALILSEVEQGGISVAAAYSVLLIAIVFGAIAVMYAVVGRALRAEERLDMALGASA
jgi:iron(III) transport system permease protein